MRRTGLRGSARGSARLRARAVVPNFSPGRLASETYFRLEADLQSFTSNLPIVVVVLIVLSRSIPDTVDHPDARSRTESEATSAVDPSHTETPLANVTFVAAFSNVAALETAELAPGGAAVHRSRTGRCPARCRGAACAR